MITVDGEDSAFTTDENGKVSIELAAGKYVISARSDHMTLVPPVCIAEITEAE